MNAIVGGAGLGLFNSGMQELGLSGSSFGQANNRYYVNGATGNLIVQRQDQVLKSHGLDTSLIRTYNSRGDAGQGDWYFRFEQKLNTTGAPSNLSDPASWGSIIRTTADGFKQEFDFDSEISSEALVSATGSGAHDTLGREGDYWVYTEGSSQTKEYYTNTGVLVKRVNAQGFETTYEFDAQTGNIHQIRDASGQITEFTYDSNSVSVATYNSEASTGTRAQLVTYRYDTDNRLSQVVVDLTPYDENDNNIHVTSYEYDGTSNRIAVIKEWEGGLTEPAEVAQLQFKYYDDAEHKLKKIIVGTGEQAEVTEYFYRPAEANQAAQVDVKRYLKYSYDESAEDQYTGTRFATTTYTFDSEERISQIQTPANQHGIRHTSYYGYDDQGNLEYIQDNNNRVVRRGFDEQGNLKWEQDGEGNYARYEYNSKNLLIAEKHYTHSDIDTSDNILPADVDAQVTRYYYDAQNRLRFVVDAKGQVSENRYFKMESGQLVAETDTDTDASNDLSSDTDYLHQRVEKSYQYLTTLTEMVANFPGVDDNTTLSQLAGWVNGQSAQTTQTTYDFRGQVKTVAQLDTDGSTLSEQHFVYDGYGRLLKTFDGRGNFSTTDGNRADNSTRDNVQTLYVYDGLGRLLATAVASVGNANVTENALDITGAELTDYAESIDENTAQNTFNTVSRYEFSADGGWVVTSLTADQLQTTQTFDSAGRLIEARQIDLGVMSDGVTDTTQYHYDQAGRLVMTVDPEGVRTHQFYNQRGQLIGSIDGSGALVEYQYNASGQLERTLAYANYLGIAQLSRLVTATNSEEYTPTEVPLEEIRPEFSADDRLTRNLYDDAGRLAYTIDGEGYVTEYQYDGKGQLINTIQHSTPYEGYDYVSEDGIAITTTENEALAAFARQEYEAGRFEVVQRTWLQEAHQANGELNVDHLLDRNQLSQENQHNAFAYSVVDAADSSAAYAKINGAVPDDAISYDITHTVQSYDDTLGEALWSADFTRASTIDGQPIETSNPNHYGYVAYSGTQFGIGGNVNPYFEVKDGILELKPYDVFYHGDTNWLGQGNLKDQMIFAGTRQYNRSETPAIFEYEFSQDSLIDNDHHVLLGIGDEHGNQIGIRLSEQYSFTDTKAHDSFYSLEHFPREPGKTYKITAEVDSAGVQFYFAEKLADGSYQELTSPWATFETLEGWGNSIHSVMEIAGNIEVDITDYDPLKIHAINESGALLRAPFQNITEGLGYNALTFTHDFTKPQSTEQPHNWGFSSRSGDIIGEGDSPFFDINEGTLQLIAHNDGTEASNTLHSLEGTELVHNPSLPANFKYFFTGGDASSYSRFFLGVNDLVSDESGNTVVENQYGILLKHNDMLRATGISGSTYSNIDTSRTYSQVSYLEFELVAGKLNVYYAKDLGEATSYDRTQAQADAQANKVLVYEEYVGNWGDKVQAVMEVRDQSSSPYTLDILDVISAGTPEWTPELYEIAEQGQTSPGIKLGDVLNVVDSTADNYVDPSELQSITATLEKVNYDGTTTTQGARTTYIHPDLYDGSVEIYQGKPEDLDDGQYNVTLSYTYIDGRQAPASLPAGLQYIHNGYKQLEQTPNGLSLNSVTGLDSTTADTYSKLIVTLTGEDTGYQTEAVTELSIPELYTGYLNLSNSAGLPDDVYTYSVKGIRRDTGEEEAVLLDQRFQVGDRHQYDHTFTFKLDDGASVNPNSVQIRYWKTDGGAATWDSGTGQSVRQSEYTQAASFDANGQYTVTLSGLLQGHYRFDIEYLQTDGTTAYGEYSIAGGTFEVTKETVEGASQMILEHLYWEEDTQESGAGISVKDYLSATDAGGNLLALEGTTLSSIDNITHLHAIVRDAVTQAEVSRATTLLSDLPTSTNPDENFEYALILSDGEVLAPGEYTVEVTATLNDTSTVTLNGLNDSERLIITSPYGKTSNNTGRNTRIEWDNEPGKDLTLTFGEADSNEYYEVEIINSVDGSGAPSATLYKKQKPENTFKGKELGQPVKRGILPGENFGDNNLALDTITTQVNSYSSVGNYVNAGLIHDITSPYQNEAVNITGTTSADGNTHTLTWDARTVTQTFEDNANGFSVATYGEHDVNTHAYHQDGQLLLRSTGGEAATESSWYQVTGERNYTHAAPSQFAIDFNVGRAQYDGFIGLTSGSQNIGIRIGEDRSIRLFNNSLLSGANTGITLDAQATANSQYRLEIQINGSIATLTLKDAEGVTVGSAQNITLDVTNGNWDSFNLLMATAGNNSRIGNPLIIEQTEETGLQAGQVTSVKYRQEGESEWTDAGSAINLIQQGMQYQTTLTTGSLIDSDGKASLEIQIQDTSQEGTVLRQSAFAQALSSGESTTQTARFSTLQDQSVQKTGTAIDHYFNYDDNWHYAITTIKDTDGNVIDTVTTWAKDNATRALILSHDRILENATYTLEVDTYNNAGVKIDGLSTVHQYIISDESGTANQTITWKLDLEGWSQEEIANFDSTKYKFNYRVDGSNQAYQALDSIVYDAGTQTFSITLEEAQGQTLDFVISELDDNNDIANSFNGKIVVGQGTGTVIENALAIRDALGLPTIVSRITDQLNVSSTIVTNQGTQTNYQGELVLIETGWLSNGVFNINLSEPDYAGFNYTIGGSLVDAPIELTVSEAYDNYLIQHQDANSGFGDGFSIELAKDLSQSRFDSQALNSGRYAFGVEFHNDLVLAQTKDAGILILAEQKVSAESLDRFYTFTSNAEVSKQISVVTDADTALQEMPLIYNEVYVRSSNTSPKLLEFDVEDHRFSQEIRLERPLEGNSGLQYYFDVPEQEVPEPIGIVSGIWGSENGLQWLGSGVQYAYFITDNGFTPEQMQQLITDNVTNQYEVRTVIEDGGSESHELPGGGGYVTYGPDYWETEVEVGGNTINSSFNPLFAEFAVLGVDIANKLLVGDNIAEGDHIHGDPVPNAVTHNFYENIDGNTINLTSMLSGAISGEGFLLQNDFIVWDTEFQQYFWSSNVTTKTVVHDLTKIHPLNEGEFSLYRMAIQAESTYSGGNLADFDHVYQNDPATLHKIGDYSLSNNVYVDLPTLDPENPGRFQLVEIHYQGEWVDALGSDTQPNEGSQLRWSLEYKDSETSEDQVLLKDYNDNVGTTLDVVIDLIDTHNDDQLVRVHLPVTPPEEVGGLYANSLLSTSDDVIDVYSKVDSYDISDGKLTVKFDLEEYITNLSEETQYGIVIKPSASELGIGRLGDIPDAVGVSLRDQNNNVIFGIRDQVDAIDRFNETNWGNAYTFSPMTSVQDISDKNLWLSNPKVNLIPEYVIQSILAGESTYSELADFIDESGQLVDGTYHLDLWANFDNESPIKVSSKAVQIGPLEVDYRIPELKLNLDLEEGASLNLQYRLDNENASWAFAEAQHLGNDQFSLKLSSEDAKVVDDSAVYTGLEKSFEFRLIAQDPSTGKEFSSAEGSFSIDYSQSEPEVIDVTFTRDIDGRETRNFYDVNGQLQAVLYADGAFEEYLYNGANQLIQTIRYGDRLSQEQLNANPSFAQAKTNATDDAAFENRYSFIFYDAAGRVSAEVDSKGFVTEYSYVTDTNLIDTTTRRLQPVKSDVLAGWINNPSTLIGATFSSNDLAAYAQYTGSDRITDFDYNQQGAVTTQTEKAGDTSQLVTNFAYDAMSRLEATSRNQSGADSSEARTSSTVYDAKGRVKQETIGNQTWAYQYDQNGLRTQATLFSDESNHANRTTRYFYDANGRLVFTLDAANQLNEIKYNAFGDVVGSVAYANYLTEQYLGVNPTQLNGGLLSANLLSKFRNLDKTSSGIQHAQHSETYNYYNRRGELRIAVDALGNRMDYQYNAFGDTLREIRYARGGNLNGQTITNEYIYDKRGRLISSAKDAYGLSQTSAHQYDAFGRLVRSVDGNGVVRVTQYDQNDLGRTIQVFLHNNDENNLLSTTENDAFGRVVKIQDTLGNITQYTYNDVDRSLTITSPEGIETTTTYNEHGETVSIDSGEGYTLHTEYDQNGRVERTYKKADGDTISEFQEQFNQYYSSGLLKETTDANNNIVTYHYDAAQRLIKRSVDPLGINLVTETLFDNVANGKRITERAYISGDLSQEDEFGYSIGTDYIETVSEFDANGRLSHQVVKGRDESEDIHTHYQYDDQGREILVSMAATHQPEWVRNTETGDIERVFADGQNVVRYEYDRLGRRIKEVRDPSYIDTVSGIEEYTGLNITTQYVYDDNNNLINSIAPNGANTYYYYDAQNRQRYSVNHLGEVTENRYDGLSNNVIATVEYANAVSQFKLKGGSDLDQISARLVVDANRDRTTEFVYDTNHRLVYTRNALGYVSETLYDANSNRIVSTKQYEHQFTSSFEGLSAVQVEALVSANTNAAKDRSQTTVFDTLGRAVFQLDASGALTQNHYDNGNRLIATVAYAEKPSGALTTYEQFNSFANAQTANSQNQFTWYVYDKANRQTAQVDAEGYLTESYYDKAGRITTLREYKLSLFNSITAEQLTNLHSNPPTAVAETVAGFLAEQEALQQTHITQVRSQQEVTQQAVYRDTGTEYDKAGRVVKITDAEGMLQASYVLDDLEFKASIIDAYSEHYTYDQMGNRTSLTNKKGDTWYYRYDALGRLLEERTPQVSQTRVQGVVSSVNFEQPHGLTSDEALASALTGYSYTPVPTDESDFNRISFSMPTLEQDELEDLPEDVDSLEDGSLYMQGEAFIQQNESTRNTSNSWQVDFDVTGNLVAEIGLEGSLYDYDNQSTNNNYGFALQLAGGEFKVSHSDGGASMPLEDLKVPGASENDPALTIEQGENYRAIFSVTKHSTITYEERFVDTNHDYLLYDENAHPSDELERLTANNDAQTRETILVPVTVETATLHIQLLRADGEAWEVIGTHKIENQNWVHIAGEQDASAHLSIKTHNDVNGNPTGTLGLDHISQVLPDARRGEWQEESVTIETVESLLTQYEYDSLGNLTRMMEAAGTPEQRETQFYYDRLGRQQTTVHQEVNVYWEAFDQIAGAENSSDLTQGVGYTNNARFERIVTPREHTYFDTFGNATAYKDVRGNYSYKLYDQGNQLRYEIDAEGYVTYYEYDGFGNTVELTRFAKSVTSQPAEWAALVPDAIENNRFGIDLNDFETFLSSHIMAPANDRSIVTTFDKLGRKIAVSQTVNNVVLGSSVNTQGVAGLGSREDGVELLTGYDYDAMGRVVREWQQDFLDAAQTQPVEISVYHFYNNLGQKIATVDQEKYLSTFQYDGEGNLIGQVEYANRLVVDNQAATPAVLGDFDMNSQSFDEAALVSLQSSNLVTSLPEEGVDLSDWTKLAQMGYDRHMRFEYDALDRQVALWQDFMVEDVLGASEGEEDFQSVLNVNRTYDASLSHLQSAMEYDALGNIVKSTDASGAATHTYYDKLGRVTAVIEPERLTQVQDTPEQLGIRHLNKGTNEAALQWNTPQLAGISHVEFHYVRYQPLGADEQLEDLNWVTGTSDQNDLNADHIISINADGTTSVDLSGIGSDKYRYKVVYYRLGDSQAYGLATGVIDIITESDVYNPGDNTQNTVVWADVTKLDSTTTTAILNFKGAAPQNAFIYIDGVEYSFGDDGTTGATNAQSILIGGDGTDPDKLANLQYGLHNYVVEYLDGNNELVRVQGSYRVETGTIAQLNGQFGMGESHYQVHGRIKEQQWFNWDSSKPNWKGHNKVRFNMSGFDHLGLTNVNYYLKMTKSNAMGGTKKKLVSRDIGTNVSSFKYSDYTRKRKKYHHGRLDSLDYFKLEANYNGTPGDKVTFIQGKGSHFDVEYLEFYNLAGRDANGNPQTFSSDDIIIMKYRVYQPNRDEQVVDENTPELRSAQWKEIRLTYRDDGYYVVGKGALPNGQYEYQLFHAQVEDLDPFGKLEENHNAENITGEVFNGRGNELAVIDGETTAFLNLGQIDAQVDIDSAGYSILAPLSEFQYDSLGNRVNEVRYAEGARIGSYGIEGYERSESDADQERMWRYNINGNMRQYQDAEGHSTYFSYDEAGNLRKEWSELEYTDVDGLNKSKVQGKVYHYDKNGQKVSVISLRPFMDNQVQSRGDLSIQEMAYNGFGEMIGRTTFTENEWLGWLSDISDGIRPDYERADYSEYFDYDQSGRLIRSNQQGGVDTHYFYDLRGRVIHEVRHSGEDWVHGNKAHLDDGYTLGSLTQQQLFNDLVVGSRPLASTQYEYNQLGQVVATLQPNYTGLNLEGAAAVITPLTRQTLDRWGNVVNTDTVDRSESLGAGESLTLLSRTEYRYNQRNQQIATAQYATEGRDADIWNFTGQVESEQWSYDLDESGLTQIVNQTYYDKLGRDIATQDANEAIRGRYYDAGGNEVRIVNAEGYHDYQAFDALGNLREKTNALGHSQYYVYDKENRLTHHFTPAGGETRYTYDSSGNRNVVQQLTHLDEVTGTKQYITTTEVYDAEGRVVRTKTGSSNVRGLHRWYSYDQYGNKVFENRGPSEILTPNSNGVEWITSGAGTATWQYDAFGRMESQNDFGGIESSYAYDHAGRMRTKSTDARGGLDAHTIQYDYQGNGLMSGQRTMDEFGNQFTGNSITYSRLGDSSYTYDYLGRQVKEVVDYNNGDSITTESSYDGFGRLQTVSANSADWNEYSMDLEYSYDAMGNRRYVKGTTNQGTANEESSELWYHYDIEGRIILGQFNAIYNGMNQVTLDTANSENGLFISYDEYGNRQTIVRYKSGERYSEAYEYNADNRHSKTLISYEGDQLEDYSGITANQKIYDYAGRLLTQYSARHFEDKGYSVPDSQLAKQATHYYYNDLNQQVKTVTMNEALIPGSREEILDARESAEVARLGSGGTQANNVVRNTYNTDGTLNTYYTSFNAGSNNLTYRYRYTYQWFDDAQTIRIDGRATSSGDTQFKPGSMIETYDVTGKLVHLNDQYNNEADRGFYLNGQGQIVRSTWDDPGENKTKDEYQYYSSGRNVGESSISTTTTYSLQIEADHTATSDSVFSFGDFKIVRVPDVTRNAKSSFDANFQEIGNYYPAPNPGTYTVQSAGERLESIAMALWGDSSLWYMLADENGLDRNQSLSAGQTLRIPNVMTNLHNTADTFKPYNPGEIIGNTLPEVPVAPPPAADAGCGAAQIIVIIVAVVVSIFTAGAGAALAGMFVQAAGVAAGSFAAAAISTVGYVIGGAITAVASNVAGQVTGMALGVQDNFNWSSVSDAAKTGAVSGLFSGLAVNVGGASPAQAPSNWSEAAGQAVSSYAQNYAANRVLGNKPNFSWAELAGNVVAAGVVNYVSGGSSATSTREAPSGSNFMDNFVRSAAESYISREISRPHAKHGVTSNEVIFANAFGSALGNSLKQTAVVSKALDKLENAVRDVIVPDRSNGSAQVVPYSGDPNDPNFMGPHIPQNILAARQMQQEGWDFSPRQGAYPPGITDAGVVDATSNRAALPKQNNPVQPKAAKVKIDFGSLYGSDSSYTLTTLDTLNYELNLVADDVGSIQAIEGSDWRGIGKRYAQSLSGGYLFTDIQDRADIGSYEDQSFFGLDSITHGDIFDVSEYAAAALGLVELGINAPRLLNSGRQLFNKIENYIFGDSSGIGSLDELLDGARAYTELGIDADSLRLLKGGKGEFNELGRMTAPSDFRVVDQGAASTCVACSITNSMRQLGENTSLQEVFAAIGKQGPVNIDKAVNVFNDLGISEKLNLTPKAELFLTLDNLKDSVSNGIPAIVRVADQGRDASHAIMVDRFVNVNGVDAVKVVDSQIGGSYYETLESFSNRFLLRTSNGNGVGYGVLFRPN